MRINWIPGHSGHNGNEVADRLAKLGTRTRDQERKLNLPLPKATITQEIKRWQNDTHQRSWIRRTDCRQSKMAMPEVSPKYWKSIKKMNRSNIKRITQMYTGHNTLRRHLYVMQIEEDPTCEQCLEDEETAEHYLCSCPTYGRIRQQNFGSMVIDGTEIKDMGARQILKYIKETKRYQE